VISNGTIELGLHEEANLGYDWRGLKFNDTGADAINPGCMCEGWGIADTLSGVSGYANDATDAGANNMNVLSFTSTASTANSVVQIGNTFKVTHDWHPSSTPSLYEGSVTVENISAAPVRGVYRRVMDWDVSPTEFNEYVTIKGTTGVLQSNNNGFNTANPLGLTMDYGFTGEFTDAGPFDHGAMFDFNVGTLNPGQTKSFTIYYGAAGSEAGALAALAAVGAQTYSLGQPSIDPAGGTPNTFAFGYKEGCIPGLNFASPLSMTSAYTMSRSDTVDIRFTYGNASCSLDNSVTLVVRNNANARIRYVAHVLNHDLAYDTATGEYHVLFSPVVYGIPAGTTARADVYFGGTRVGYALINVTP
jgi:hypothetical protein